MAQRLLIISPKVLAIKNFIRNLAPGQSLKGLLLASFISGFWLICFVIFCRVLHYFRSTELIGDLLSGKLLSMILLTFFSILLFSNIVCALTSFFLSDDLHLLHYLPLDILQIYLTKLLETFIHASWMLLIFGLPVFLAYGVVYRAGPLYYIALVTSLICFAMICTTIGTAVALVLVNIFPVRRIKDIFFLLTIILMSCLYVIFRILQPEKLVNPEAFSSVASYIEQIRTPTSPLLPSHWVKEALFPLLLKGSSINYFSLLLLISTALAFIVLGYKLTSCLYLTGFTRAQEARPSRPFVYQRGSIPLRGPLGTWLPLPLQAIISKEIKGFFRDTSQWSQILLLLALIIVYLYNIWVLPLDKVKFPSFYLENLISFLNLGLAGFVISAVAARFVFPAVSLEREAVWLIKTSPVTARQFLLSKYLTYLFPLLILAEILVVVSNRFLHATTFLTLLSTTTIFFMTLGITSLGIGLGAKYPHFKLENPAQLATSYGGVLYMVTSLIYISVIVTLEARPVYMILYARFRNIPLTMINWMEIGVCLTLTLILHLMVIYLPFKMGIRQLERIEC